MQLKVKLVSREEVIVDVAEDESVKDVRVAPSRTIRRGLDRGEIREESTVAPCPLRPDRGCDGPLR
jgi:hypothetical protein